MSEFGRGIPGAENVGLRPRAVTDELSERRAAVADLGDALRELLDVAVRCELPAETLSMAAEDARAITDSLSLRTRELSKPPSVDDLAVGVRMLNPVIGQGNPVAPPLTVEIVDDGVEGRCTLGAVHEGPHMFAHGGMSALILDQILGHAAAAAGNVGVTTDLTVRYRRPVPLGVPLRVWARATEVDGRRTSAEAGIATEAEPDVPLVLATARFLQLDWDTVKRMYPGVGGDVPDPKATHD